MKINLFRDIATRIKQAVQDFTGYRCRNIYIAGRDETPPVSRNFPTRFAQMVSKYHGDKT